MDATDSRGPAKWTPRAQRSKRAKALVSPRATLPPRAPHVIPNAVRNLKRGSSCQRRNLIPAFVLAIALLLTLQACSNPDPTSTATVASDGAVVAASDRAVTVTRVIDGDTVDVCCPEARVRLLGIDSPERGEPLFDEATELAKSLADGQSVRLEKCLEEADRYGRLLRHIFIGDTHVNREIVAAGLATAYEFSLDLNPCYETELRADQAAAQAARIGIWAQ